MKFKNLNIILAASVLCLTVLGACGPTESSDTSHQTTASEQSDNAGQSRDTEPAEDEANESLSDYESLSEIMGGTFRASDYTFSRQDQYDYPFMGLNAVLPESLMDRMDRKEVAMLPTEEATDNYSALKYAFLSWNLMTEEQKNAEVEKMGTAYDDWFNSLERIGALGVYQSGLEGKLDELTKCTQHQKLGQSADGAYQYYLSTNPDAGSELTDELKQITVNITEIAPFQQISAFEQPFEESNATNVGEFTTQDIHGETYTQKLFEDYDLTMVNVFTTWCSPCVNEIPDLEKLHKEMSEKGVNVVGIVMDTVDGSGNLEQETIEKTKILAERTGATYPFLIPDAGNLNGLLNGMDTFPQTFFIDREGNIMGEPYIGSGSLEDWKEIVLQELENLKGAAS